MMRAVQITLLIALLVGVSGCGYRFGNYTPNGVSKLHIERIEVSKSCDEPRMGIYAAERIRTAFVSDGSVKISGPDRADARLIASVDGYKVTPTGSTRLTPPDPSQKTYVASVWTVTVRLRFKLVPTGVDEKNIEWRTADGLAIFSDVLDITTVRQAGIRQALVDAAKKLVRESLDVDWKPVPRKT